MGCMSTRYVSQGELLRLLRDSRDLLAQRAIAALDPAAVEMVPVREGAFDKATYEVRLARAEAGEGPKTSGLASFVEALNRPDEPESVGFRGADGTHFLLLLDGGQVVAITIIEPS
jgi:hypothetical protein